MRVASIHANANPAFSGIIYFNTTKHNDVQTDYPFQPNIENVKKPASADILALFNEAEKTTSAFLPILDEAENIHSYAKNTISKVNDTYLEVCISNNRDFSRGTLRIKDDNGVIKTEAAFDRDGNIEIIKDYENNNVILFNRLPSLQLKSEYTYDEDPTKEFTVFIDCENIEDNDLIKAKESFSYRSGSLRRYTGSCGADINYDRFYSDFAYTFKRGIIAGFDSKYTVAAGTEYSNKCFVFDCKHYDYEPVKALSNASPVRYVENKVFYNGAIRHSTKELRFSDYKFPFEYFK